MLSNSGGEDLTISPTLPPVSVEGSTTTTSATTTTTLATTTTSTATTTTTLGTTTTSTPAPTTTVGLDVGVPYAGYELITDDDGLLEVSVPTEWADRLGVGWDYNSDGVLIGPALTAAIDRQAWLEGWATPGVFLSASAQLDLTPDEMLDDRAFGGQCEYEGRLDYDDGEYRGRFDTWIDCGAEGSTFIVVASEPYSGGAIVLVQVIIVTEADRDALREVLETFRVIGDLTG